MQFIRFAALVLSLTLIAPVSGRAATPLARGKAFAQQTCARCHAIGPTGRSRNPKSPPFRVIAAKYPSDALEEALAEGIVVSHVQTDMPAFEFEPDQIADLLTYIGSLKRRR